MLDFNELGWFTKVIDMSEQKLRIANVNKITNYMLRLHDILQRKDMTYKGDTFVTAKIVLNTLKQVIGFHTSYLIGNPVVLIGNEDIVSKYSKLYKRGNYSKVDYEVVDGLYTFGNAFEYVYLDKETEQIKSKVINNQFAYPIYNEDGEYVAFVEYWKDKNDKEHYITYVDGKVTKYLGNVQEEQYINLTGLPIHYASMDKMEYIYFGDSLMNDLIPIMNQIEKLLSKLDDAVTTLSLNPVGISSGQQVEGTIDRNIVGAVLNLEMGADFKYATSTMDYNNINLLLNSLLQQLYLIAGVPSSVMGQSNIANVSEVSLKLLFTNSENIAKGTIQVLKEGFNLRYKYFNLLLDLIKGEKSFDEETFDTLDYSFVTNRPVDTGNMLKEMKMQWEMDSISKQTIIERSPYTPNSTIELERLLKESDEVVKDSNLNKDNVNNPDNVVQNTEVIQ